VGGENTNHGVKNDVTNHPGGIPACAGMTVNNQDCENRMFMGMTFHDHDFTNRMHASWDHDIYKELSKGRFML